MCDSPCYGVLTFTSSLQVFNSKRLRSDALLGGFTCDLGTIYEHNGHYVLNKWLLLNDSEDEGVVRGYLKICVAILGPGADAPVSALSSSPLSCGYS